MKRSKRRGNGDTGKTMWRVVVHRQRGKTEDIVGEYQITFSTDERRVLIAGAESLSVLQRTRTKSFEMWMVVGLALKVLRNKVMHGINTEQPAGYVYNAVFGEWMARLDLVVDKAVRFHLFDLMDNREEVEQWRATKLEPKQRLKLTHPSSVWRRWQAWKASQTTDTEPSR